MRVAIISDIHGNYHALEAVLAEVTVAAPDELWCLGDIVGYGADPNRCCSAVAAWSSACLAGNHDLAVLETIPLEDFNEPASDAIRWTNRVLDDSARTFLEGLSPQGSRHGVGLFHGSPIDPVWDYVMTEERARESFAVTSSPLILVGHTHLALQISTDGDSLTGGEAGDGEVIDLREGRWLLNPGSVGQPRGGDPRAAWLLVDNDEQTATFHRTEYAISAAQEAILDAGLPKNLAARLELGA